MSRFLIRGGYVLTLGSRTTNHTDADVLVENDHIVEIGTGIRARDAEVVDASDAVIMPGFVDAHSHVWKSLFRNAGPSDDHGPHHRPDDVYAATLLGLLGAAEAGVTTVVDWSDVQTDESYTDAVFSAHSDSGLRTVLAFARPGWSSGGLEAGIRTASTRTLGPTTTLALGSSSPTTANLDIVAGEWAVARELGLRVHAHAGRAAGDAGAIARLGEHGGVGADVTLVHCTNLDDSDLDAVASAAASVALAAPMEMAAGAGFPPLQALIDRHVRPGLAIDAGSITPGDMFAQMRAVNSVQHATSFDLKLAGKAGIPTLLNTRDVIRHATIDGARAIGLGTTTGSLEPGKQADLIVLRTDRPNIFPINDPIGAVVWGMDTSNLDWVFVAGRPVMRDGSLIGDVARARDLAVAARDRVAAAAGLLVASGDPA